MILAVQTMERLMSRFPSLPILGLAGALITASLAQAQNTPYIGFAYPAGGQQGTATVVKLGGQRIDGVSGALVTGKGVSARLAHYYRKLSNQEILDARVSDPRNAPDDGCEPVARKNML